MVSELCSTFQKLVCRIARRRHSPCLIPHRLEIRRNPSETSNEAFLLSRSSSFFYFHFASNGNDCLFMSLCLIVEPTVNKLQIRIMFISPSPLCIPFLLSFANKKIPKRSFCFYFVTISGTHFLSSSLFFGVCCSKLCVCLYFRK